MMVVAMSQSELSRYDTLLRVKRRELRIEDAATLLGLSRRQVGRLLIRLRLDGAEGLVSRKRAKPSNRRHSDAFREGVHVISVQKVPGSVSNMGVWLKLGR
jgi:predicted transcriptional regulator